MKIRVVLASLFLVSFVWFVGCNDDDPNGKPGFGGNGGTSQNNTNQTNAPPSMVGSTVTHTLNSSSTNGTSGSFTIIFEGVPGASSGTYRMFDSSSTQTTGTFSSSTSANVVLVNMQDSMLGTVTEDLIYLTPSSGNFRRNIGTAPTQDGTFTSQ